MPNDNKAIVTVGGIPCLVTKFDINPDAVIKLKTDKEMFGGEIIIPGTMNFTDFGESLFFNSGRLHVDKAEQN